MIPLLPLYAMGLREMNTNVVAEVASGKILSIQIFDAPIKP